MFILREVFSCYPARNWDACYIYDDGARPAERVLQTAENARFLSLVNKAKQQAVAKQEGRKKEKRPFFREKGTQRKRQRLGRRRHK